MEPRRSVHGLLTIFKSKRFDMRRIIVFIIILCCFSISEGRAQQLKALRDSLAMATEKLSYYPDSIDLRLKKAHWNIELKQWRYAKDEYDAILQRNPTNVAALYYRAFVNEKLSRYHFARLDYEHMLTLVPGNFEGQLGLALLNQKDKRYTEAFDQINHLVSQFPENPVAYAARAGIEFERNMFDLAEFDFSEALRLDPKNKDYLLNRADVRIKLKKFLSAKEDLDLLMKLGESKAALWDYYKQIR